MPVEENFDDTRVITSSDSATTTQAEMNAQMEALHSAYRDGVAAGAPVETRTRVDFPPYRSSILRHPTKDPKHVDPETIELHSPAFGHRDVHRVRHTKRAGPRYRSHLAARNSRTKNRLFLAVSDTAA